MIFELAGLKFNIEFFHTIDNKRPCLLFIHGFTGSSNDWIPIFSGINHEFSSAGIDLIGHGKSDSPEDAELYSADAISDQINNIVMYIIKRNVVLIGYSMGGRAALTYSIKYPEKIKGLILESTSIGIKDEKLRKERIKEDEGIASFIRSHSMDEFVNYWLDKEIFNTQRRFSEERRKEIKIAKSKNNPIGLANSLLRFGTGKMPVLNAQLRNIKFKTLLLTGELDSKFTSINTEIIKLFPIAEHKIIKNAGHNTHLEEPVKFIEAVNEFLESLYL